MNDCVKCGHPLAPHFSQMNIDTFLKRRCFHAPCACDDSHRTHHPRIRSFWRFCAELIAQEGVAA